MNTLPDFYRKLREVSVTSLFLKKHVPQPSTIKLLQDLYPNVNWSRVDFYEGLPWFTPLVAPYVTAQALPQFYSFGRYRIYLKKFDESRAQCLADIVHEAYHIMQAMEFANGYGLGFFRGMMVFYNALFFKFGYRQNPFEIPAYNQEYRFLDFCTKHHVAGIYPPIAPHALDNIKNESSLVARNFPFSYNESKLVLLASIILCLIISIIKPFADLIVLVIRSMHRSVEVQHEKAL